MAATLGGDTSEHAANDFHLDENVHAQIYRKKIAQFQSENRHLKELVVRHQAVLKEYQVAYPELKPATKLDRQQPDGLEAPLAPLPPWIASPDALGPLLAAYDRRVQTLEGKLDAHKMAVEHLKDETTGIQAENECLRKDVKHYVDKLLARGEGGEGGDMSIAVEQEMNSLQQQFELSQESNQVMALQIRALETDMEQMRQDLSREQQQKEQAVSQLQALQVKIQHQEVHSNEVVQKLRGQSNASIARLQDEIRQLQSEKSTSEETIFGQTERVVQAEARAKAATQDLEKTQLSLNDVSSQLHDCTKRFEALVAKSRSTEHELIDRLRRKERTFVGIKEERAGLEAQTQAALQRSRELERANKALKTKEKSNDEYISCFKRRMEDARAREDELEKACADSCTRLHTLEMEVDGYKEQIRSLTEHLRRTEEEAERAKVQDAASDMEALKAAQLKFDAQLSEREAQLNKARKQLAEAQSDNDRVLRSHRRSVHELQKFQATADEERIRFEKAISELTSTRLTAEEHSAETEKREQDIAAALEQERRNLTLTREQHKREREMLRSTIAECKNTRVDLEEEVGRGKAALMQCRNQFKHVQAQLNDSERRHKAELERMNANFTLQTQSLQQEVVMLTRQSQSIRVKLAGEARQRQSRNDQNLADMTLERDSSRKRLQRLQRDFETLRISFNKQSKRIRHEERCRLDAQNALECKGADVQELTALVDGARAELEHTRGHLADVLQQQEQTVMRGQDIHVRYERERHRSTLLQDQLDSVSQTLRKFTMAAHEPVAAPVTLPDRLVHLHSSLPASTAFDHHLGVSPPVLDRSFRTPGVPPHDYDQVASALHNASMLARRPPRVQRLDSDTSGSEFVAPFL